MTWHYKTHIEVSLAKIGYAAQRLTGESLAAQLVKLRDCEKIFHEKLGRIDDRTELNQCLEFLSENDIFVITKLEIIGRSINDLLNIVTGLIDKNVNFVVIDLEIDTSTRSGTMLLHNILEGICEFERNLRARKQAIGLRKAIKNGVKVGPKAKLTNEQIGQLRAQRDHGVLIKDLMAEFSLSKASIYRILSS